MNTNKLHLKQLICAELIWPEEIISLVVGIPQRLSLKKVNFWHLGSFDMFSSSVAITWLDCNLKACDDHTAPAHMTVMLDSPRTSWLD